MYLSACCRVGVITTTRPSNDPHHGHFIRNQSWNVVSWEPEGHYQYSKMFRWEPEGHYCCTMSIVIAPFWFSMENLWVVIAPFWLSTDNVIFLILSSKGKTVSPGYFAYRLLCPFSNENLIPRRRRRFTALLGAVIKCLLLTNSYHQIRARRALSQFNDVPLRTRRVLSP